MNVLESPINKSLIAGGITFVISAIVLNAVKPDFVMTIDEETNEEVVDNFKLYIFCIMISVCLCIIVFLCFNKKDVIEYHKKILKKEAKSY
jgi:choline-glycine betaine transporter